MERKPTLLVGRRNSLAAQRLCEALSDDFTICGSALSGQAVVDLSRALKPEIVLTDYFYSDLTGKAILRSLREEGFLTPVIFLSGVEFIDSMRECFDLGFSDYLKGSVPLSHLRAALQKAIKTLEISSFSVAAGN